MNSQDMWQLSDEELNATVMTNARQAIHRYLYAVANSNAMNGVDRDTVVKNVLAGWQIALYVIAVIIVVLDVLAFMAVRRLWTGMNKAQRLEAKASKWVREGGLFFIFSNLVTVIQYIIYAFLPNLLGLELAGTPWSWSAIPVSLFGIDFTWNAGWFIPCTVYQFPIAEKHYLPK